MKYLAILSVILLKNLISRSFVVTTEIKSIDDLHNWLQANPPLSDIDDRYD